jgi:hypothetical protein
MIDLPVPAVGQDHLRQVLPMVLSLERIMAEMEGVGFRDCLWPKFPRTNAIRVLSFAED